MFLQFFPRALFHNNGLATIVIKEFIGKWDILPLMCATDKVWITIILGQFVTCMRQFIGLSDIKKTFMTSPIKTITSVLKALTDIITNNPALPIGLVEILVIMSVSTFKSFVILYITFTFTFNIDTYLCSI